MKRALSELLRKKIILAGIVVFLIGGMTIGLIYLAQKPRLEIIPISTPALPPVPPPVPTIKIRGPGDAIFNLATDGYWWPGRTVEKWVEVKNIGNLPFDFEVFVSGHDKPSYDFKGDGANVSLEVNWPKWEDIDRDDREGGKWHIVPGGIQRILIRVYFPLEGDNTCQGDIWTITFTFQAISCLN